MTVAYCTISAANYLPRVRVLENSFRQHNPGVSFHVLLVESPSACTRLTEETGFEFVSPADVCPYWEKMSFYYDVTEFSTALKPFFIEHLFDRGYEAVVYLDPDIQVFSPLTDLTNLAKRFDLVLTPHICEPLPDDGARPTSGEIIKAGVYNLGFIALRASDRVIDALRWWQTVCVDQCLFDAKSGLFVDQFWAGMLPCFIQETYCLRESGYNIAYWNVFQRFLQKSEGTWKTKDGDLFFFHFSGVTWGDLSHVSRHQNRVSAPPGSDLHQLLVEYGQLIQESDWAQYRNWPYTFGYYANGDPISNDDRRLLLSMIRQGRNDVGAPFLRPHKFRKGRRSGKRSLRVYYSTYRELLAQRGWVKAHVHIVRILFRRLFSFV